MGIHCPTGRLADISKGDPIDSKQKSREMGDLLRERGKKRRGRNSNEFRRGKGSLRKKKEYSTCVGEKERGGVRRIEYWAPRKGKPIKTLR